MAAAVTPAGTVSPEILARLRARDETTLQHIVHTSLPRLLRAARGAGLNVQNAEDVVQATFLTFFQKLDDFAGRSRVETWLFGILYRKIAEMRREVQRRDATDDIDQVMERRFRTDGFWANPPRATDSRAFDAEVRRHLANCLEDLTADQRMAFVLREVEELESHEICNILGVSRTNLGVLLYRGRNRLRECLERHDVGR